LTSYFPAPATAGAFYFFNRPPRAINQPPIPGTIALSAIAPSNLGQASRIPGVSHADVTALMLWLELDSRRNNTLVSTPQSR